MRWPIDLCKLMYATSDGDARPPSWRTTRKLRRAAVSVSQIKPSAGTFAQALGGAY